MEPSFVHLLRMLLTQAIHINQALKESGDRAGAEDPVMHQTSSRTIRITVKCLDEVICEHPGRSRGSSSQKELRAVRDCRQFKEVAAMAGGW